MHQQAPLNLPFVRVFGHGQEIEVVRVFQNLFSQIGAGRGKCALKIGQRLPFPLMQGALDLEDQDISAPAVFDRSAEIPLSFDRGFQPVEQDHMMTPGQLCSKLLHNWLVGPGRGKRPHVLEASCAETLDAGKLSLQVMCQPLDNLGAPALGILASEDLPAYPPVEEDQFPAHGKGGANLGGADAGFQLLKEFGVTGGCLKSVFHLIMQIIRRGHRLQRQ